jgi:rubrerythrin
VSETGETSTPALLIDGITLREVLDVAMGFEQTAQRFYLSLKDRVAAEVQPLVADLAEEEGRHYSLLAELADDHRLAAKLATTTIPPGPADHAFRAYVAMPSLGEHPEEDEILDYAASRERIAREHYAYLAETASPGPMQALFSLLRDEEHRHESLVERRWSETFSSL